MGILKLMQLQQYPSNENKIVRFFFFFFKKGDITAEHEVNHEKCPPAVRKVSRNIFEVKKISFFADFFAFSSLFSLSLFYFIHQNRTREYHSLFDLLARHNTSTGLLTRLRFIHIRYPVKLDYITILLFFC